MLKKTVLFLICALPLSMMAQQETKLGHVNFQEVFAAMPEQATIQKTLDDQSKVIEGELAKMNEEHIKNMVNVLDYTINTMFKIDEIVKLWI